MQSPAGLFAIATHNASLDVSTSMSAFSRFLEFYLVFVNVDISGR